MPPDLRAQLRSLVSGHIRGVSVKPGDLYWATLADAHLDIAERRAEVVLAPNVDPPAAEAPEKTESRPRCLVRSPGWPVDRMSAVAPVWSGQTVVCVASGPSLAPAQLDRVRGLPMIAVNDCYLIAPWADICYFADAKWWEWHKKRAEFTAFAGQKCSIWSSGNAVGDPSVFLLRNAGGEGLSTEPGSICTGSNSGHQAINIATLNNPKRVLLLGYDCRAGAGGRKHWFGDHPDRSEPPYSVILPRFATIVPAAKKLGIEIINCTPGSALKCFPQADLASVLPAKGPA